MGIRRLPSFLAKLWNFFWTLGMLSLYVTIASVVLGFFVPMGTPRWFGFLKDFSFVVFLYLYMMGMTMQNIDAGYPWWLVIILLPAIFILQFVGVILEAVAVMYALILPPKGFDIIKWVLGNGDSITLVRCLQFVIAGNELPFYFSISPGKGNGVDETSFLGLGAAGELH